MPTGETVLKFPTPDGRNTDVLRLTNAQARAEYSRLRSIAVKRLKRIGQSEFRDSTTYRANINKYVKLSEIQSPEQLDKLLSDVSRMLSAQTGSLTGLREKRKRDIERLHQSGFTDINESNYNTFVEFMEFWRSKLAGFMYSSGDTVELFEAVAKADLDIYKLLDTEYYKELGRKKPTLSEVFSFWVANKEKVAQIGKGKVTLTTRFGRTVRSRATAKNIFRRG